MVKKITWLVMAVSAMGAVTLFAQGGPNSVEGTLTLDKKNYSFKQAIAFETTIDNEDAISVVLSGKVVPNEKIKEARENDKQGGDTDFGRPFLKLIFKKTGELKYWGAAAGGTSLGRHSGTVTGELKVQNGRATGKATQPLEAEGMFPSSFDVKFDVALLKASDSLPASTPIKRGPAANVKPTVSGLFKGNGKEANLAFVSAQWVEPFADKPSMQLVFTEKDHSKDKKPEMGAMFGHFGSALIISVHEDGTIFGCQVVHTAHKKQGFSSVGNIEMTDFTYADGKVEGELSTNGELDAFGEKWEVKIKFLAPLGDIPKEFQVAPKPEKKEKPAAADKDDDDDDDAAVIDSAKKQSSEPAAPGLKAKELALTKDATDVDYKAAVEHVVFKSKSDVKKVCAELAANLKAQGWTGEGADLVNPQSSILTRKRGKAKLTIFVKPDGGGSTVQMFTEGLTW